jgi:hypothetical protein
VQVGTASFISPGAAQRIAEGMEAWMLAQGETDIRHLIGALGGSEDRGPKTEDSNICGAKRR